RARPREAPGVVATAPGTAPGASPAAPAAVLLKVVSTPAGARVLREDTGEALGVTPLELSVSEPQSLRFELRGYQPAEATAHPEEGATVEVTLRPSRSTPAGAKPPANRRGTRLTNPDGTLNPFGK
ncbi:PEGA domain-containing protein, partial [Pyxidicoccus sp. 3LG]